MQNITSPPVSRSSSALSILTPAPKGDGDGEGEGEGDETDQTDTGFLGFDSEEESKQTFNDSANFVDSLFANVDSKAKRKTPKKNKLVKGASSSSSPSVPPKKRKRSVKGAGIKGLDIEGVGDCKFLFASVCCFAPAIIL
jgi:hypothetical protein